MSVETLHSLFVAVSIAAAILTAVASIGTWWTGRIIDQRQATTISSLQRQVGIVQPRHLTGEQRAQLIQQLKSRQGKIGFYSRLMDGESAEFADQLSAAFNEAGWDVLPTNRTSLNDFPGFLSLFVTGANLDAQVNFICEAFKKIGIDCHPEPIKEETLGGTRQLDAVYVVVGRKRS